MTNNEAEYEAALVCLEDVRQKQPEKALVQMDSMLVVKQLGFEWACRSSRLLPAYEYAVELLGAIRAQGTQLNFQHIHREFNAVADSLANQALDQGDMTANW